MKPMIQAHLVERDQFGFWTHPNYLAKLEKQEPVGVMRASSEMG